MIDIPQNEKDDKKSRMDKFVEFVLDGLKKGNSATIYDESRCNCDKIPGISYGEARELASMFCGKGYHAKAYYIDCPCHGFRSVTIANYVLNSHEARCAHSEVWG